MLEWTQIKVLDGVELRLVASASGIRAIQFDQRPAPEGQRNDGNPLLTEAARQLRAYFAGALREFSLPLDLQGTDFQKRVWARWPPSPMVKRAATCRFRRLSDRRGPCAP